MAITLHERRRELFLTSTVGVLLLAVILLCVNALGSWFFLRWDLTRSRAYSLSPSSRSLARSLEDPLLIKVYFTPDLPSPYNAYGRYVKDLLMEYRTASHGRVRFEVVSPLPAAVFEQQAEQAGLFPIQFQEVGSDQFKVRRGFMGLVFYYRDKVETIPMIRGVESLEFDITSRIVKLSRKQRKVLAMTTGHGEPNWRGASPQLAKDLGDLYEIRDWALPASTTAMMQADVLMVAGPQFKLDAASLRSIDHMMQSGVPTLFCVDGKKMMFPQFYATPSDVGLEGLLKTYGVELGTALVYDMQSETVAMTQSMKGMTFTTNVQYAFLPSVTHFEKGHPAVRGLEVVAMPFVTRIDPVVPLPAGVQFEPLFYSSPLSWLTRDPIFSVNPSAVPRPTDKDPHGPFTLAAVVHSTTTTLAVLGTSQMLNPQVPGTPGAASLIANLLAYLTHDDVLLGIRDKGQIVRPLKPVSPVKRELVRWGSMAGAPLVAAAMGVWRWRKRNRWRTRIAAAFVS